MKKFISLIAASLTLQAMPASAIVGGPWDNDNFNQVNQGTYQAALFLRNGVGMARFQDDVTAQFSRFNQSIIYYRGIVYTGTAFGLIDHQSDLVIGVTNGNTNNQVLVEQQQQVAGLPLIGLPFNAVENSINSGTGRNIGICNSSWRCDITHDAPIMRFSGDGEARFFGTLTQFVEVVTETSTTTQTLFPDPTTIVANVDTLTTTTTDTGGESGDFPDVGVRTRLWVFGSQISVTARSSF